jgi:hypothetical protein
VRRALPLLLLCACPGAKETLADGGALLGPVTFHISFNSSKNTTMYLQVGREQEWLEIQEQPDGGDRTALPIASSCVCRCDQCNACGDCAERKPKVIQVPKFGTSTTLWSGLVFPDQGGCKEKRCQAVRSALPGKYIAHYCWSSVAIANADGTQTLGPPINCGDQTFDYPTDGGSVDISVCDC